MIDFFINSLMYRNVFIYDFFIGKFFVAILKNGIIYVNTKYCILNKKQNLLLNGINVALN